MTFVEYFKYYIGLFILPFTSSHPESDVCIFTSSDSWPRSPASLYSSSQLHEINQLVPLRKRHQFY